MKKICILCFSSVNGRAIFSDRYLKTQLVVYLNLASYCTVCILLLVVAYGNQVFVLLKKGTSVMYSSNKFCMLKKLFLNFYSFESFPVFLLLLTSNIILLWSEKILWMIPVLLSLLRFNLWPKRWSILENVPCAFEKKVYAIIVV